MTEKQKQLKISFPHKTKEGYNEQEVWADSRFYNEEISIRKNEPFTGLLVYSGFTRGRSSLNIRWADQQRKSVYYSGMKLLDEALMNGAISGNKITGTFCFKKQGTSILLEQI